MLGFGIGLVFMPAMSLATPGRARRTRASPRRLVNTSQQVGGSIGTALLNTIARHGHGAWLASRLPAAAAHTDAG